MYDSLSHKNLKKEAKKSVFLGRVVLRRNREEKELFVIPTERSDEGSSAFTARAKSIEDRR